MSDCFIVANELGQSTGKERRQIIIPEPSESSGPCVTAEGETMTVCGRVSVLTLGLYAVLLLSPVAGEAFQQ